MTNFIFKSHETYKKLANSLLIIQNELRHQRVDNQEILFLLNKILNSAKLQKQVDEFYDDQEDSSGISSSPPLGNREDMD